MVILKDADVKIDKPEAIVNLLENWLDNLDEVDRDKEHFFTVILDARNKIKAVEVVTIGLINSSLVHPREVFRRSILESAVSIIIAHNHPSGDCQPSDEDIRVTDKMVNAGNMLGIELFDHIILGGRSFYSFRQHDRF